MLTPSEFHNQEVKLGPPVKVSLTCRLSIPMDSHLQHAAWEGKCDKSVLVRQAIHEFFAKRGINAWSSSMAPIGGSAAPQ